VVEKGCVTPIIRVGRTHSLRCSGPATLSLYK